MPDSAQAADAVESPRLVWVVPAALAVAFCAYNLFLVPISGNSSDHWYSLLAIGIVFAQPVLAAVWTALGPGSFVIRLPACSAALVVWILAVSIVDWNVFAPDLAKNKLNVEMAIAFLAVFVLSSTALGAIRRWTGLRIARHEAPLGAIPSRPHQFGMRYLLGWMTGCAVLTAIARTLAGNVPQFNEPWVDVVRNLVSGITFLFLLILPPILLPLFCLTRPLPWRAILIVVLAWPVSLWTGVEVMKMGARGGTPPNVYWVFSGVQLGATLTALTAAVILRAAGFRLSVADSQPNRPAT